MKLEPLFSITGKAALRALGRTPEGERQKAEFHGNTMPGSAIEGKASGFCWILQPPLGTARVEIVQEIATPAGERFAAQLRGSARELGPGRLSLKAAGVVHPADGAFAHLDGRIVFVEGEIGEGEIRCTAYHC
jgi:hypothetical protein